MIATRHGKNVIITESSAEQVRLKMAEHFNNRETCENLIRAIEAYSKSENFNEQTIEQLRARDNHLWNNATKLGVSHNHLMITANEQEKEEHKRLYAELEEIFLDTSARLRARIAKLTVPERNLEEEIPENQDNEIHNETMNESCASTRVGRQQIIVKLAGTKRERTWGEFDGEVAHFRDRFKTAVHSNDKIAKSFKLQCLKDSLKGRAAREFGDWPSTNEHYDECWEWLNRRYDRPYQASKELLWKFYNLPKLERATGYEIGEMISYNENTAHQEEERLQHALLKKQAELHAEEERIQHTLLKIHNDNLHIEISDIKILLFVIVGLILCVVITAIAAWIFFSCRRCFVKVFKKSLEEN